MLHTKVLLFRVEYLLWRHFCFTLNYNSKFQQFNLIGITSLSIQLLIFLGGTLSYHVYVYIDEENINVQGRTISFCQGGGKIFQGAREARTFPPPRKIFAPLCVGEKL